MIDSVAAAELDNVRKRQKEVVQVQPDLVFRTWDSNYSNQI